jgi:hypothetical protein
MPPKVVPDMQRPLLFVLALLAAAMPVLATAQSVSWPSFGPNRDMPHVDGLTDVLPDFVGPVDGSAELTIFSEGNHFPVLLPLVLEAFPAWCRSSGACNIDPAKILIVTLPQAMVVDVLIKGGVRLGNAVIPVGQDQHVFPDLVMGGEQIMRQLAKAGLIETRAFVFARHRGLGLLLPRSMDNVRDLKGLGQRASTIVLASESEAGARSQYQQTLEALMGRRQATDLLAHEIRSFPGRLGIQHRDVPYAVMNGLADGGIIFAHLAAFYARQYPDRLAYADVPGAERFGQQIAVARTVRPQRPLTEQFERFFREAARTAYPENGFAALNTFDFGSDLFRH